ncbi:MAG: FAD-binding domain-containing protein [Verrucomicrobiota bacterium]
MYKTTRSEAWKQLQKFSRSVESYQSQRNYVRPKHTNVSRLSPVIRCRLIDEYEVARWLLDQYSFPKIEKFIQEVFWRSYWKGWLEWHPAVWDHYERSLSEVSMGICGSEQQKTMDQILAAEGPLDIINEFVTELKETGYLHNHARMWFAGYWIHTRKLPWQLGADFFYQHLLDADPASNTLSWRWVAGLHTKGKQYLARASNIEKFCDYPSVNKEQLDEALANTTESFVDSNAIVNPVLDSWHQTTPPKTDEAYVLWLHGEDLSFWENDVDLGRFPPKSVIAVIDQRLLNGHHVSNLRQTFLTEAMQDAVDRISENLGVEAKLLAGDLAETLLAESKRLGVKQVFAINPAVGPLRQQLDRITKELNTNGIRLETFRRSRDELIWPLAKKGFFPFWQSMKKRLRSGFLEEGGYRIALCD